MAYGGPDNERGAGRWNRKRCRVCTTHYVRVYIFILLLFFYNRRKPKEMWKKIRRSKIHKRMKWKKKPSVHGDSNAILLPRVRRRRCYRGRRHTDINTCATNDNNVVNLFCLMPTVGLGWTSDSLTAQLNTVCATTASVIVLVGYYTPVSYFGFYPDSTEQTDNRSVAGNSAVAFRLDHPSDNVHRQENL